MTEWFLTSKNVCVEGKLSKRWIHIRDEKIKSILDHPPQNSNRVTDLGDLVILPGLVDSHVHINEPGRTEWEGFITATHAAAAGGVTTLVDMPLNCIPVTTTAKAFQKKLSHLSGELWVDAGFWGGAVPENIEELPELLKAGVLGVKSFMIDSGIDEFKPMTPELIDQAMPILAEFNLPYLFHAEFDQGEVRGEPDGPSYKAFLNSRPKSWENNAIDLLVALTRKHKAKTHIVHLSSAEALKTIKKAKLEGLKFSAETCPHYLVLSDAQVSKFEPKDEQTVFKCCPPIRDDKNREMLWEALKDGTLDMVVSDHSPCTPELKLFGSGDFGKAWGGISSLQFTLSLLWTEGQRHSVTLPQISAWISQNPAKLAGLERQKGRIASGLDADFAIFDPTADWTITSNVIEHRHKASPYNGREVKGKVVKTYLRGKLIYDEGQFSKEPLGKTILREQR